MFSSLDYQENLEMIKYCENIKQAKSDFKYTNPKFLSVFDKESWWDSMVGYWTLFFLVEAYVKDSLNSSMIYF